MSVRMKYVGATGDANFDVARETGGPAAMTNGETYEVSEELAARLALTRAWEAPKSRASALQKLAAEQAEQAAANHSGDAERIEQIAAQQEGETGVEEPAQVGEGEGS